MDENGPLEDDFPIEHGQIPASYVSETQEGRKGEFQLPQAVCDFAVELVLWMS